MKLNALKMKQIFEDLGYFKEYYANNKFIGFINHVEKDREVFGYFGRRTEVLDKDITLDNKRKLRKGTEVVTQLQHLSGRRLGE